MALSSLTAEQKRLVEFLKPDRNQPGSLAAQLTRTFTLAFAEGLLQEGSYLIPQRDLASALGVSRVTLRKAIDALERQGLLEQRQGSGTVIKAMKAKPIQKNLAVLNNFTDDMLARGLEPSSVWLNREQLSPSPKEAMALDLSTGDRIFRLTRIRKADGIAIAFEIASTPAHLIGNIDDIEESLYQALEGQQARPVRALQSISAANSDPQVAKYLNISQGDAVLYIERKALDPQERAVEYTRSYFRADMYDLVTELKVEMP